MERTVRCPGCDAELVLPMAAGDQAMQCPRCQRVFRTSPAAPAPKPQPSFGSRDEDLDFPEPTPIIRPRRRFIGWWLTIPTMVLIAATIIPWTLWAYVCFEEIDLREQGKAAFVDGRWDAHFGLSDSVEFAVQATGWPAYLAFAIWSAVAARNSKLLQATGTLPASSVGLCFFCCPLLNAVIAYINLQDAWRSSDPNELGGSESWRRVRPSPWIRGFGLILVAVPILVFVAFRLDTTGRGNDRLASVLLVVANLMMAAASGMLVVIIANITYRQRQRYINLYEDPA